MVAWLHPLFGCVMHVQWALRAHQRINTAPTGSSAYAVSSMTRSLYIHVSLKSVAVYSSPPLPLLPPSCIEPNRLKWRYLISGARTKQRKRKEGKKNKIQLYLLTQFLLNVVSCVLCSYMQYSAWLYTQPYSIQLDCSLLLPGIFLFQKKIKL